MTAILTAAEMRALEQEAIARGDVTGLKLMERAGRGVVEAILAEWPEIEQGARRAVVLCGPGNNGGDGFVVARLLKERGWDVRAFFFRDAERMPPDARTNFERYSALAEITQASLNLDYTTQTAIFDACIVQHGTCVVLDAIFGIGLRTGSDLALSLWLHELSCLPNYLPKYSASVHYVAVDVPSGLCADSGRVLENAATSVLMAGGPPASEDWETIPADLTVTFHSLKPGHLLAQGPGSCGKVVVTDIGLAGWRLSKGIEQANALRSSPADSPPGMLRKRIGHKYSHGHALLLSGGCGRGGAARLAARGALRIGAGLVTLAVPPAALQENAARLDAIMLRSVRNAEALADLLSDPRTNALLAGPGLGTGEREAALLHALLDASRGAGQEAAAPAKNQTPAAAAPPPSSLPDQPRPDQLRPDQLRPDQLRPDQLRPDQPGPDQPGPDQPGIASAIAPLSPAPVPSAPSSSEAGSPPPPSVQEAGTPPPAPGRPRAVVLDADALTLLSKDETLRAKLHPACILTPHDGEFARLFPAIAERLHAPATTGPAYSKVDAARDAAREAGCIVLLKGPDTVIADPTGRAAINAAVYDRAAPWLATAGSGDVLAGMICGLLARGFPPYEAACTAAWLHVEAARSFGPGLIAEDLPEELPKVFRTLGL